MFINNKIHLYIENKPYINYMMLIQNNHKLHPLCYISEKHWLAPQNVPKQVSLLPNRTIVTDTRKYHNDQY